MTGPGEGWGLGFLICVSGPWTVLEGRTLFSAGATLYEIYESTRLWGFCCWMWWFVFTLS